MGNHFYQINASGDQLEESGDPGFIILENVTFCGPAIYDRL
jgi:hypothetical protein